MSLDKPLDEITEADLKLLITDRVPEQQTIDYKKGFTLDAEPPKNEFRADVSSFANASGGHLIIGMDEKEGLPTDLCGIDVPNPDLLNLRIDDVLQNKITPRIPGVAHKILQLSNQKSAVIIRIPQSFAKPHQVTVNKDDFQFWTRGTAGKHRLTVDELRSVILQSESLTERIRKFRLERLGNIVAGETPVPLGEGAKIMLHLIPLTTFDARTRLDLAVLENVSNRQVLSPLTGPEASVYSNPRYNLDGFYSVVKFGGTDRAMDYLQVFRNGALEAADAFYLNQPETPIWTSYTETVLINGVARCLEIERILGVPPPFIILVTLIGVRGYRIYRGQNFYTTRNEVFTRDTLMLPDVLVEDANADAAEVLRPILDAIWNEGGYARCLNYDDEGKRIKQQ